MPTYDFECVECGAAFEEMLSYERCDEAQFCPEGCDPAAQRQIGRGGGITIRGGKAESDPLRGALVDRANVGEEIGLPFDLETAKHERRIGREMDRVKKAARQNERDARSAPGRRGISWEAHIPHSVAAHQIRQHGSGVFSGDDGLQRARDLGYGLGN